MGNSGKSPGFFRVSYLATSIQFAALQFINLYRALLSSISVSILSVPSMYMHTLFLPSDPHQPYYPFLFSFMSKSYKQSYTTLILLPLPHLLYPVQFTIILFLAPSPIHWKCMSRSPKLAQLLAAFYTVDSGNTPYTFFDWEVLFLKNM